MDGESDTILLKRSSRSSTDLNLYSCDANVDRSAWIDTKSCGETYIVAEDRNSHPIHRQFRGILRDFDNFRDSYLAHTDIVLEPTGLTAPTDVRPYRRRIRIIVVALLSTEKFPQFRDSGSDTLESFLREEGESVIGQS